MSIYREPRQAHMRLSSHGHPRPALRLQGMIYADAKGSPISKKDA
jgi:hypothetical protein